MHVHPALRLHLFASMIADRHVPPADRACLKVRLLGRRVQPGGERRRPDDRVPRPGRPPAMSMAPTSTPTLAPPQRDPADVAPADSYHPADPVWVYRDGWRAGII